MNVIIDDTTTATEATASPSIAVDPLTRGASVEVRRRFDDAWARGFEISDVRDDGYALRRLSDGAVLPVTFPATEIRRCA